MAKKLSQVNTINLLNQAEMMMMSSDSLKNEDIEIQ